MKFIFKMLVLVGMILVGKFLKQAATNEAASTGKVPTEDTFSLNVQEESISSPQTQNHIVPTTKKQTTEDTFTYSFN